MTLDRTFIAEFLLKMDACQHKMSIANVRMDDCWDCVISAHADERTSAMMNTIPAVSSREFTRNEVVAKDTRTPRHHHHRRFQNSLKHHQHRRRRRRRRRREPPWKVSQRRRNRVPLSRNSIENVHVSIKRVANVRMTAGIVSSAVR